MTEWYKKIRIILLLQLFCCIVTIVGGQNINLKVVGNTEQGFNVDIYNRTKLLVQNSEEFKLKVANLDLSEIAEITDWKGSEWSGNKNSIRLSKETYLESADLQTKPT